MDNGVRRQPDNDVYIHLHCLAAEEIHQLRRKQGMITRCQQARLVVYQLGRMKGAGVERARMESSMAKLQSSRAAVDNALDGMQIFGGYSCTAEYEIGRLLMEAKSLEFGEGTSELHTKIIAETMLGARKG